MTGDLGPDQPPASDLSVQFEPYVVAAAGLAAEQGDEHVTALLGELSGFDARLSDAPVTSAQGQAYASVDLTLHLPPSYAGDRDEVIAGRIAELLNEVAAGDGYRVRNVTVEVSAAE